jgi:hypothetical protein
VESRTITFYVEIIPPRIQIANKQEWHLIATQRLDYTGLKKWSLSLTLGKIGRQHS